MSWIIALAVALLFMVVFSMFSLVMPKFQVVQKLIDRLNLVVRENLEGLLVVRAFAAPMPVMTTRCVPSARRVAPVLMLFSLIATYLRRCR